MAKTVVVVDCGSGNLTSVIKAMQRIGAAYSCASDSAAVAAAEKLILPGVGHFKSAMQSLQQTGVLKCLNETVVQRKTPVLGICLGMQLMASRSEEGPAEGLGWLDARVVKFRHSNTWSHKIPHTGWNEVSLKNHAQLFEGIPDRSEFYFTHSYHLSQLAESSLSGEAEYDYAFPAAFECENLFGVQFHPEKSHDVGERLLRNFVAL